MRMMLVALDGLLKATKLMKVFQSARTHWLLRPLHRTHAHTRVAACLQKKERPASWLEGLSVPNTALGLMREGLHDLEDSRVS